MQQSTRLLEMSSGGTPLLIKEMKDYSAVGMSLIWQRQMIFGAALALAAFYYSVPLALVCVALIAVSEVSDLFLFRAILRWRGSEPAVAKRFLILLCLGTVLSAGIISFYAIGISYLQGPTTHFMPLFFLFAAALFAAMNNHQLLPVLIIRLMIYGSTFLFIPIRDIVTVNPDLHSELWAQLFSSVFVLYFVIDCSRIYMNFYKLNMQQVERLEQEIDRGNQALKAKSEFLSTMSHELRTPLTSIKGSIDMVHSGRLDHSTAKVKSVISIAQRNCDRLVKLINEILDLQKVESGIMEFKFEVLDLSEVIQDVVRTNLPYAESLGITISMEMEPGSIFVTGDKSRLEQVFGNILSNAAKFSPEHSNVIVKVSSSESKARIDFIDEGAGLSENDKEKVFDRFSQIDSSDTRKIGGTGLGMNISKIIVDAHGGKIDYRKNETVGTTFFVDLDRVVPIGDLGCEFADRQVA